MRLYKLGSMILATVMCYAVVAQAVTIETVPVGNPGNANDPTTGYGSVGYAYQMGKYEVTNAQYCEFLNAKLPAISSVETGMLLTGDTYSLYNCLMETNARGGIAYTPTAGVGAKFSVKSGYANMPVTYVSWYDGLRFANWLQNGKGNGSTESGTYAITLGEYGSSNVSIPDAATRASWNSPHWVLPSENEWYKAAYHQPAAQGGDTDNYWLYPTSSNSAPYSDNPASLDYPGNSANYCNNDVRNNGVNDGYAISPPSVTDVGAYSQSLGPYGTLDQAGNVWEWNEAQPIGSSSSRGMRGGSWTANSGDFLAAFCRSYNSPGWETYDIGFRVASVPEPGSLAMLAGLALTGLLYWWQKRA